MQLLKSLVLAGVVALVAGVGVSQAKDFLVVRGGLIVLALLKDVVEGGISGVDLQGVVEVGDCLLVVALLRPTDAAARRSNFDGDRLKGR